MTPLLSTSFAKGIRNPKTAPSRLSIAISPVKVSSGAAYCGHNSGHVHLGREATGLSGNTCQCCLRQSRRHMRTANCLCPMSCHSPINCLRTHTEHELHETCHYVTCHCTGQFTPKMKANAEPRLLSSLVRIDSGVVVSQHRLESFYMK